MATERPGRDPDQLTAEADRIRGEIVRYVQVSQAVREQAEMLSDHLGNWRPEVCSPPTAFASE